MLERKQYDSSKNKHTRKNMNRTHSQRKEIQNLQNPKLDSLTHQNSKYLINQSPTFAEISLRKTFDNNRLRGANTVSSSSSSSEGILSELLKMKKRDFLDEIPELNVERRLAEAFSNEEFLSRASQTVLRETNKENEEHILKANRRNQRINKSFDGNKSLNSLPGARKTTEANFMKKGYQDSNYFEEKVRQLKQEYIEGKSANSLFLNRKSASRSGERTCMTEFSPKVLSGKKLLNLYQNNDGGEDFRAYGRDLDNESNSVDTFNTELMSLANEGIFTGGPPSLRLRPGYTKIFIPFLMEDAQETFNDSDVSMKIGEEVADLYKVEGLVLKSEKYTLYQARSLISSDNPQEKVMMKVYKKEKVAFDLGLQEINNYMNLYDKKIDFDSKGISKMRDYFYFRGKLAIVTEYRGPLISTLNKRYLSLSSAKEITSKLLSSLKCIHDAGMAHLKINMESIHFLVDELPCHAIFLSNFENTKRNRLLQQPHKLVSADCYSAPEILLGLESFAKADIWSVGCFLYEILTSDVLFESEDEWERIYLIKKTLGRGKSTAADVIINMIDSDFEILNKIENSIKNKQRDIAQKLTKIKTNFQLLRENKPVFSLLTDLLQINPSHRPSCEQALCHIWFQSSV